MKCLQFKQGGVYMTPLFSSKDSESRVSTPRGRGDFVILVYDANVKRVAKFLKTCRKYLTWVQNSVFEGFITRGKLKKLVAELETIMEPEEDSIIIYRFSTTKYSERYIMGKEKITSEDFMF